MEEDYWPGDVARVDGYPVLKRIPLIRLGPDGHWYQVPQSEGPLNIETNGDQS